MRGDRRRPVIARKGHSLGDRAADVSLQMLRLLVIFLCALAALLAAGAPAAPERAVRAEHAGIAGVLVHRINGLRANHGLAPVRPAPALRLAALAHTRNLVRRGAFTHDSADGSSFSNRIARFYGQHGFSRWSVGENLLSGPMSMSPDQAVDAWLASPAHRRILLDPDWRDIGVVALFAWQAPGRFGGHDVLIVTSDFGSRTR
jgi:uncharacterized protein YkwD